MAAPVWKLLDQPPYINSTGHIYRITQFYRATMLLRHQNKQNLRDCFFFRTR